MGARPGGGAAASAAAAAGAGAGAGLAATGASKLVPGQELLVLIGIHNPANSSNIAEEILCLGRMVQVDPWASPPLYPLFAPSVIPQYPLIPLCTPSISPLYPLNAPPPLCPLNTCQQLDTLVDRT